MKNITKILSVAMSTLFLSQANAGIQVIDFDTASNGSTITNGQIVDDEYNGVAITSFINRGSIENRQVTFDTLHNSVQDNDLEFNRTDNDYNSELTRTGTDLANYNSAFSYTALEIDGHNFGPNPGNILILQNANRQSGCTTTSCTNPDDENGNPAGYFEFTFDFLVDIISLDTFDFEESNLLTAQFFDADDNEISTGYVFSAMVDGGFKRQDIEINGVQRLVLNLPGSGAIDNLVYRTTDVPAPTTLSIFAIALLFAVRRARR